MYAEHPSFHLPTNPSAKIWRYMDFTKFVSLLETNALYFPRIDQLGDPYEFALPVETRKRFPPFIDPLIGIGQTIYASCWHCNEYESAAMWRVYLKSDEGIAIQSTVKRLIDSFAAFADLVYIGVVSYIDYDKDDIRGPGCFNVFDFALLKRISYAYENEIRAITCQYETTSTGKRAMSISPGPMGLSIPLILEPLIEAVYVAPTAQKWLVDLVEAVMKRYGLKAPVIQSNLAKPPR